jgi:hypothetical protein
VTNFKVIAEGIDTTPILAGLERHPEMWTESTMRQNYVGSEHKDTEAIWLRAPAQLRDVFNVIDAVWVKQTIERLGMLGVIEDLGLRIGARLFGRALLVRLKPGGHVTPHIDQGAYAEFYARFHLVVKTPAYPRVVYFSGEEDRSFDAGTLFWFNNRVLHEVLNPSDEERIHLILDAVAPGYCGQRG